MKKKIIYVVIVLLIIGIIFLIINGNKKTIYNENAFHLDNEYYNKGEFINLKSDEVTKLLNDKKNFILFTYNNYCSLPISCDSIFQKMMKKYNIDIVEISFEEFKKISLYDDIKLAPSIIIIKDGIVVDYLRADSDEDLSKYQDVDDFSNWVKEYVIFEKKND